MKKIELIKEICSKLGIAVNISGPDYNGRFKIKEVEEEWSPVAAEQFWFRKKIIEAIYRKITEE
jgi:hypothetical protein